MVSGLMAVIAAQAARGAFGKYGFTHPGLLLICTLGTLLIVMASVIYVIVISIIK